MRSAFFPFTAGSITTSSSAAITSVPTNIVRLAMPPFAHGATSVKLRLQHNLQSRLFRPLTPVCWQPDNALALDPCAAQPDLISEGTVNLADFETEFGNNLASKPAGWILKPGGLDRELVT